MTVLNIVEWPEKVLETNSEPIKNFDDELKSFVRDMHETMRSSRGIGLAANQVGVAKRVIVIEIPFDEKEAESTGEERKWWHDKSFTFINPVITKKSGTIKWQEGCLSFPEVYDFVDRAREITVKAFDENGQEFEVEADELFAVCLQHEIDHIDGIVFFKRMSQFKASRIKSKMLKRGKLHV
jgi:peptide deformylase